MTSAVAPASTDPAHVGHRRLRNRWEQRVLAAASVAVFALAPVEGLLLWLQPDAAKLPAAVLGLCWVVLRWRVPPAPRPHAVHVLLAILVVVVSASAATHLTSPFAVLYTGRWLPFLILTAILVDLASSLVSVRLLAASAVVGAAVASAGALYGVIAFHESRSALPQTDPNDLACALVAALPLVLCLSPRRLVAKAGVVAAFTVIALAVVATQSRGGLLALAAAAAWLLARRAVPLRPALSAVGVLGVLGVICAYVMRSEIADALAAKVYISQRNTDTRLMRWHGAAEMFGGHPFLGVGPGGFRTGYPAVSGMAEIDIPAQQFVTHNMYLEVAAELGLLGLVAMLAVLATAFACAETALRHGIDRRVAIGVQASLIGVAVAEVFLSGEYFFALWSVVALGCALGIRARYGERI